MVDKIQASGVSLILGVFAAKGATQVCFSGGTLVHTPNGLAKIEELQAGDLLLTYNEETQEQEYKPIVQTHQRYTLQMMTLELQTGKVEYVGQTTQGTQTRFEQHIAEGQAKGNFKSEWGDPTKYKVETVKSGNWTPYESHAWEQHYIEKNGGKANLKNSKNAISEGKYNKFANQHNPC